MKQYAATAKDREPPPAASFCSNDQAGKVTLTAAEWDQVRASTQKYAKLIGRA